MRVLVIADVHGNLSCLEALVKTKDYQEADKRISLGDTIVDYSRPNECIKFLNEHFECVIGNNDSFVCSHIPTIGYTQFSKRKINQITFMHDQVSDECKQIGLSWPKELEYTWNNKKFYFTHYPWIAFDDVADEPAEKNFEKRQELFGFVNADYVIFGHEHDENHFVRKHKTYYCVGSLGLRNPSNYIVINIDDNGDIWFESKYIYHEFDKENDLEATLIANNQEYFK